jgi:hypothetical protein
MKKLWMLILVVVAVLTIMGNLSKANLDYILKWEGGLSKHPRDSAARHPLPDGSGYHTNKGITWRVFRSHIWELRTSRCSFLPNDVTMTLEASTNSIGTE